MITPVKIDGFKEAHKDHLAVKDIDIVYFGPYERLTHSINDKGEKAPFGCEWVDGFGGKASSYLLSFWNAVLYTPIEIKTETETRAKTEFEIEMEKRKEQRLKDYALFSLCPKGFKLAPLDHVLEVGIDLLALPEADKHIQQKVNRDGEPPPIGYEWVDCFGGNEVIKIIMGGYYPRAYVPIEKPEEKVTEPVERVVKPIKLDTFITVVKTKKCSHINYKHFEWNSFEWTVKWCRDCGAIWTKSGRKWVSPKKAKV